MTEFKLSDRAKLIPVSGTMAVDERLQELREAGEDVIALGAGQPDFATPPDASSAGIRAINEGKTRYTPAAGIPALRSILARKFQVENGLAATADQVVVSSGAKQSLFFALLAVVNPEDDVLLPTPAWPSYQEMIRLAGGNVQRIETTRATGYKLSAESLLGALRPHPGGVSVLLLNNPGNPTGAVYTREELQRLSEVIVGEKIFVLVDEIYEQLCYDEPFVSLATLPGMGQRVITINGMSKAFAMTGWRIGYATGPVPVMAAIKAIQSHLSGNAPSISQHAAEAAMRSALESKSGRTHIDEMREAFSRRRSLLCRILRNVPDIQFCNPSGAFYFFIDVSAHFGRTLGGRVIQNSRDMAKYLLDQAKIGIVPGYDFGDDHCIRLSFAASEEDLTVAVKRMAIALAAEAR